MKMNAIRIGVACALLACASASYAADAPEGNHEMQTEKKLEAARHRLDEAAREVAELSAHIAARQFPDTLMFLGRNPNRAMLGIGVGDGDGDGDGDDAEDKQTEGAAVVAISPGGPAETAGLKAGDVITEINGKSLRQDSENTSREKLLQAISKLSPGDKAALTYRRAGKTNKATLTAQTLPNRSFAVRPFERSIHAPTPGKYLGNSGVNFDAMRIFDTYHRNQFGSIEFVPITPKLGQYFGTDKGLLVVHAPSDAQDKTAPTLEEGDVLIDIDGRIPNNPGHAFAILASYQPGEKLSLNVLRQHKKQALTITVPKETERVRERRSFRLPQEPSPLNEPTPPLAPLPPTT